MASAPAAPDRFFSALLFVTAVPLCAYGLSEALWTESGGAQRASLWVTFLGSSGHVAASFFFYTDSRVRGYMLANARGRFVWAPLSVIAAASLFFATAGPLLPYGVTLYWIWQTHHYTRQNHGILSFVGRAYGGAPSELERTALTLAGVGGVIGALTFVAPYRDTFLAHFGWHLHHIALGSYVAGWLCFAAACIRDRRTLRTAHPLRSIVALAMMLFYLPLFLFRNPQLAVGSYAMAHGLQYLIFMGYVAAVPRAALLRRALALVVFVVALGSALDFLQRAEHFGDYRMAVFGAYLGIVMWHFLLDAGIWRLSEPFQRGYMSERFAFLRA
jgi:hypothetical protein